MPLIYQDQDCHLSLREGIEAYHAYLRSLNRKIMLDAPGSRLLIEHDATHVIFGLNTTLEQEAALDTWVFLGCRFNWRYIREYGRLPELKALYAALVKECGWTLFPRIYWQTLGMKWRVFRRTRAMIEKWPFQFPEAYLDESIADLRARHGIKILSEQERYIEHPIVWSGEY